ncbi:MAG: Structural maintenance of chromosomes protein 6 [Candelina submexicana]|nr:MAG: Structural maintenance of chromosomes protein 6 [Candelina submexicana]
MAPQKRMRTTGDDGESEVVEVESARSSLRQDTKKKARVSDTSTHNKSSMVGVRDRLEDANQPLDLGEEDYEQRRDAGFQDLADEDGDTQQATQILQERNQRSMENMPADNGIIESVTCVNFMCHSKLHVSFGPLINFVIGHNGSGKSAVLTAITLCLGGKASATNRGQSLKNFVKEGQETASLIIKIKNTGHSGYQQEVYGDSIIVERHFSRSGSSSFKVKSASGRVISTKKSDLDEICDYFALQIDNPMNVLTQDMARQFLNNSTPSDKYKFFVKGVQLEQLDRDYQLLEETIDQIEHKLDGRGDDIKALEELARKARQKLDMSDRHETMRGRIRNYEHQMAWVQVDQQEKAVEDCELNLLKASQQIEAAEARAITTTDAYTDADRNFEEAQASASALLNSKTPLEDTRRQRKGEFDANKTELHNIQTEHRIIRDHLLAAESRIKKTMENIEHERQRLESANGGTHLRKIADIEEAKSKAAEKRYQHDQHRKDAGRLEDSRKAAETDLRGINEPLEQKKREIKHCNDLLQNMIRDRGQSHGAFHRNTNRLLRAIDQEGGFRDKPIGPIGSHVRLLNLDWSSVLERSFGATLESYIVTNKQDQNLLSSLMRRIDCVAPILIGNNQPLDTSQHEPDPRFETTMRVLQIENDLVRRQLIINQGIEQTLLIEQLSEGNATMFDGARVRNVKQCFCINPNQRGWGYRLAYNRSGEPSVSPIRAMQSIPRMRTDIEAQISFQRETLNNLKSELSELEGHQRSLKDNVQRCEQAIQTHKRQQGELLIELQRADHLVENLQDELEQERPEDGRLDALRAGLKEAEDEKETCEGSYGDAVVEKDRLNGVAKEIMEQLRSVDADITNIDFDIKMAKAKASELSERRLLALEGKNVAMESIETAKQDKVEAQNKWQTERDRLEDWTSKAREIVRQRVTVDAGETADSLDRKLTKLTKDLARYEKELGDSRESIALKAAQTYKAWKTAEQQVEDLQHLAERLKGALIDRMERWRKFRRYISAKARAQFTYLLSERSFRGALKTDHKRRLLDLQVEPDETRTGRGRQTKTLSGGEKSFSTICLLLSLWEAMGSPIRCLDEFDVFMDNVNRDVSMKMMIVAARRSVGRQYILITPQSMGNIDVAGDVKIIKLSDPERGQTALPFAG